ncbi:Uncharacterised protein [Bordetella pertussis]|nr:Uncharacterised protein [Bordetella pertussis]
MLTSRPCAARLRAMFIISSVSPSRGAISSATRRAPARPRSAAALS